MDKKIKVAHIITMLEMGGAQENTLYTVKNLDKNKFDVLLICGPRGILDSETAKLQNVKTCFVQPLIREINPLKDLLAYFEIKKILYKEKPDIVHTHSSKAGILGRWAAFLINQKSKFMHHGGHKLINIVHTFHGFGFNDFQNFFVKNLYIILEKIVANISDKIIFVSEQNINTATEKKIGSTNKYILIRSGIKISNYANLKVNKAQIKSKLNIPETSRIITTIGPFKPQKNLIDFIKIAKIVSEKIPDIKFLLAGDGQQRNMIETFIDKLGLKNIVLLLGWRKDIAEILSITDIFAMTSLWEGLPRSAVESLVSGKPVVAYAVDGNNDIIKNGKNGFLAEPKDINGISEKLILLLENNDLYNKMSESAKNSIDKSFDIDYMVKQQESLYKELILA